ncbi:ankyrin-3-like [Periplaneta americana]|uniref:ankyrin-3-like n=1 Tax=Periplaneta americana TaxID=6978 RepID=UPI0037E8D436
MVNGVIICMLLGCIIGGQCLVLRHRTPQVVRIREGSTLVLQADVESEEDNLWFFGPGNRQIGEYDHTVDITREEFVIQLHIWRVDRYQSGVYTLKGFDRWSNERLNWSVIVQVVPEYHATLDTTPTCCATFENPERSSVTWEYFGCDVVIRDADSKLVKEFNQCGELLKLESKERQRLLVEAVETEDILKLKTLLMLETSLDYYYYPEVSPLCAASRKGNVEISLLLLNTGASITWFSKEIIHVYHTLIEVPEVFMSPFECAALSGSIELVQIFLDRGANTRRYPRPPFSRMEKTGSFMPVGHLQDDYPMPIHFAARSGSPSLVQYFIDLGEDPQSRDIIGNTPLYYAARSGSVELVKLLVSLGSDPSNANLYGETPIGNAVHSGSVPVVEFFLQCGTNISSKSLDREFLLHIAAELGPLSLIQKLIGEGLNVTARDDDGRTPLHYAARGGHLSAVQALINAGATTSIIDHYKRTALDYAILYNRTQVVEWLSRLNT